MLKTSRSTESLTQLGKDGVGVGSNNRTGRDRSKLYKSKIDNSEVDCSEIGDNEVGKKVQKLFKFKNLSKSKKMVRLDFLTLGAKLAFTQLKQAFVKALIFHHFDPERHIRIEIDVSGYAIGGVLT